MDGIQAVKSEFSRIQTYVGLTVAALILFTIIKVRAHPRLLPRKVKLIFSSL
jgi:hypothetical protein